MKRTGRRVFLSGIVNAETADAVATKDPTDPSSSAQIAFKNILTDERKGYAYKVTFASIFPDVAATTPEKRTTPYVLQTYTRRELRQMSQNALRNAVGDGTNQGVAAHNRNVGVVGRWEFAPNSTFKPAANPYQGDYVIKGDAMITEALSVAFQLVTIGQTDSAMSYYVELDEYTVNDDEEILLLLNERAQNAGNVEGN